MSINGTLSLFDNLGFEGVNLGPNSKNTAHESSIPDEQAKETDVTDTTIPQVKKPVAKASVSKDNNNIMHKSPVKAKVKKITSEVSLDETPTSVRTNSVTEHAITSEPSKPVVKPTTKLVEEKSNGPVNNYSKPSSTQLGDVHIEVPETPLKGKEKLSVHKTYMTTPKRAKRLEEIAAARGESVNALLNEIFKQLLGE